MNNLLFVFLKPFSSFSEVLIFQRYGKYIHILNMETNQCLNCNYFINMALVSRIAHSIMLHSVLISYNYILFFVP